jgi:hypothetical protein
MLNSIMKMQQAQYIMWKVLQGNNLISSTNKYNKKRRRICNRLKDT